MWEIIRELVAGGVTIFLTTQYLEEADQLADRIAVLDHGRLVAEGTPDELKRLVPGGHIRLRFADPRELDAAAARSATRARDDEALALAGARATAASRSLRVAARPPRRRVDRGRRPDASTPPTSTTSSSPSPDEECSSMSTYAMPTDSATMLRRNLRHIAALPVADRDARRHPDRLPAAVRLRLRRHARAPGLGGVRPAAAPTTSTTSRPGSCCSPIAGAAQGDRDLGRHGHDRGHHRPLPHDGDLPRVGARPGTSSAA